MYGHPSGAPVLMVLVAIALASTVLALALQTYFGRRWPVVTAGQVMAAAGAVAYSIWLRRSNNP